LVIIRIISRIKITTAIIIIIIIYKKKFALAELSRGTTKGEVVRACWMSWVQLIALVYGPIAPLTVLFCTLYAGVAALSARLDVALLSRSHFDSAGLLATCASRSSLNNVAIGCLLHIAVLGLAGSTGSFYHIILLAPLPLPILAVRARVFARAKNGLHKLGRGRLPLGDTAVLDQTCERGAVRTALRGFGQSVKAFEPPCGVDARGTELVGVPLMATEAQSAAADGDERQQRLSRWLRRYEDAGAVVFGPCSSSA